ncbi:hypothetical protein KQI68_00890 [Peptoniphilus sp. MSJ-1]|uniref:Regulatory protein YycH domain-containing protein n=1 Tax=Peptoniphilus ovalis TaxID=2841503 RepID=A0ABS6FEA9_9FIRM|nr:hypothetical protein [Peptoniphilus ovalis]MBU5668388.1 hypothetical protein [Peptoniphilus ovalis]
MNRVKKHRDIFIIIFLIFLLIFQSRNLWLSFDRKPESRNAVNDVSEILDEILMPQRIISNFGNRNHYISTNVLDFWKDYGNDISKILQEINTKNLEAISLKDYLNLQDKESIIFKFNSPLSGSIFVNFLGDDYGENNVNISVDSIYISKDGEIYLTGVGNYYKILDHKVEFSIDDMLADGEKSGIKAINFYEAYGIEKDIYIPVASYTSVQKVSYTSGLFNLDERSKSNLAERFLDTPIDYIREISVAGKNTYVYEGEYLSISENGFLEYSLESEFNVPERNLYKSLNRAVEFIAQKTGISSGIYLENTEQIEFNGSLGYRFFFNLKEGQTPMILTSRDHSFIEIDVFSDYVKNYREFYIRKADNPIYEEDEIYLESIHKILKKNKKIFSDTPVMDILKEIDNLSIVYLSFSSLEYDDLLLVYEMVYKGNKYYLSVDEGKIVMVR